MPSKASEEGRTPSQPYVLLEDFVDVVAASLETSTAYDGSPIYMPDYRAQAVALVAALNDLGWAVTRTKEPRR